MEKYKLSFVFKNPNETESLVLFRANSTFIRDSRFQMSTGARLKTTTNLKTHRPKGMMKKIEDTFIDVFQNQFTGNDLRDPKELKALINDILHPHLAESRPQKKVDTVIDFIKNEIEKATINKTVTTGTIKNWKSLYNNISWYQKDVRFENITGSWIDDFRYWMQKEHSIIGTRAYNKGKRIKSKGISPDTAFKYIKGLKRMIRKAEMMKDQGTDYKVNSSYKNNEPQDRKNEGKRTKYSGVYLSIEEQKQLKNLVLPESKALVRDWILIACSTGQRYSDWNKLTPENITATPDGDVIELRQQKTQTDVAIPVSKTVLEIWKKHTDGMPLPTDNSIRVVIKELCKTIGLTEEIDGKPKYKHIGTHIGRYSFVSNCIDQEVPDKTIMAITGHFDKDVFSKYLKLKQAKLASKASNYSLFNEAL